MIKSVKINGLACRSCCKILEDALGKIDGVKAVCVNLEEKRADIFCDVGVKARKIKGVINALGFKALRVITKKTDYRALILKGDF